jgi:hypothetical protein
MPGNQDHAGLVLMRWSDGRFLYRQTWPVTVSTLTPDLLGDCPVQARSKPAASQHALLDSRPLSARQPELIDLISCLNSAQIQTKSGTPPAVAGPGAAQRRSSRAA